MTTAVCVAVAAAVGALVATVLSGDVGTEASPGVGDTSELVRRLEDLERRLERAERRGPGSRRSARGAGDGLAGAADSPAAAVAHGDTSPDAASPSRPGTSSEPGAGDEPTAHLADGPDAAFVERVADAIRTLQERRREEQEAAERERKRRETLGGLAKKLREYVPRLGLDDATARAFARAATEGATRLLDAQEAGATGDELAALHRENQRGYQELLGEGGYRELRKLELDAAARPTIVSIAGQAGVDARQREQIESLLSQHIESLVDLDVRARTEALEATELQSIRERMDRANRTAWDRIRREILTAEQRERVPRRLR